MKKYLSVTLGILTAVGGFVDIGDLVVSSVTGARFGLGLAWAVVLGLGGIMLFAEMSGRIAALSGRAVFDLVRERLGARAALANLIASFAINGLTLAAELGGAALAIELIAGVSYLLFIPLIAFVAWLVAWRAKFTSMETVLGLAGLTMLVFVVALLNLHPSWHHLTQEALHPAVPHGDGHPTWFYYAIGLFGSAMTPYEVFFFSSGAVEEGWTEKDLAVNKANVFVGFPLGAGLSLAIMACAAVVLNPQGVAVGHLSQAALPIVVSVGRTGLGFALLGFVVCTFSATMETLLSSGYVVAQFFGWSWGMRLRPNRAARFHVVLLLVLIAATALVLTTWDPIKLTEYAVVFSAVALPLTYLPILVVANDREYLGEHTNGWLANGLGIVYLVVIVVAALAAVPLMIATKAGL